MVTLIASALIETLTKHMFQKYLDARDKIEIGGAPSWYGKQVDDKMCTFAFAKGGHASIEIAKNDSKIAMIKNINGLIEIAIYDNYKNVKSNREKAMIQQWQNDTNLPVFVNKSLEFSRVAYEDEIDTTFVRACIDKNTILEYEKARLENIKSAVLKFKASSADEELANDLNNKESYNESGNVFKELDDATKQ